jgi:hypothetical protein
MREAESKEAICAQRTVGAETPQTGPNQPLFESPEAPKKFACYLACIGPTGMLHSFWMREGLLAPIEVRCWERIGAGRTSYL